MRSFAALVVVCALSSAAVAEVELVGEVTAAKGRWADDGKVIVTDVTVRDDDGRLVNLLQFGGRADGFGMRRFHGAPLLEVGMRARIKATPSQTRRRAPALVVSDVQLLPGGSPRFVRTGPTEAGNYLKWAASCIEMVYNSAGTDHIAGDAEFAVLDQGLDNWNQASDGCSYLTFLAGGRVSTVAQRDFVNVIQFRNRWCRPATDSLPEECYAPAAAGITTVVYIDDPNSARDGEIVDADIELNGENYALAIDGVSENDGNCQSELDATLAHELGHVLGLEHTCRENTDPPRLDGDGDPVPLCTQTSQPAILNATMYNYQACGEDQKASLEADDVAGACAAYPAAADPGYCAPPSVEEGGCGCSGLGRVSSLGTAMLLALALLAIVGRRDRARR